MVLSRKQTIALTLWAPLTILGAWLLGTNAHIVNGGTLVGLILILWAGAKALDGLINQIKPQS